MVYYVYSKGTTKNRKGLISMNIKKYDLVLEETKDSYFFDGRASLSSEISVNSFARALGIHLKPEEVVMLICVNGQNKPIAVSQISHGTTNSSMLPMDNLFKRILLSGGVKFFLVHNHPSESLEPSQADITVTRRIVEASKLLGIEFLDHVIVTRNSSTSLRGLGYL